VRTLVVAGCVTSGCVRASVVDAMCHGFRPVVVEDCVGDRAIEPHLANLFDMRQKNAEVLPLAEFSALLEGLIAARALPRSCDNVQVDHAACHARTPPDRLHPEPRPFPPVDAQERLLEVLRNDAGSMARSMGAAMASAGPAACWSTEPWRAPASWRWRPSKGAA
jgi:hypothetical protein